MAEDMIFSVHDAVVSNLDRLAGEYSTLSEQRLLELNDVAHPMAQTSVQLLDDGLDAYEMLSVLSESLTFGDYPVSDDASEDNVRLVARELHSLSRSDRTLFTELYVGELKALGRELSERDFLPSFIGDESFTYVRNSLSDEAYDVFSQDFDDPKIKYSPSLKDCARAVSTGEVTYCLLPLEERGGVRLHTVSELIFRNDFKINSVIPVFGQDGNADMKYALVSRGFTL